MNDAAENRGQEPDRCPWKAEIIFLTAEKVA